MKSLYKRRLVCYGEMDAAMPKSIFYHPDPYRPLGIKGWYLPLQSGRYHPLITRWRRYVNTTDINLTSAVTGLKHVTLTPCCFTAGPTSTTLAHHEPWPARQQAYVYSNTTDVDSVVQCWANVADAGPTLSQHRVWYNVNIWYRGCRWSAYNNLVDSAIVVSI